MANNITTNNEELKHFIKQHSPLWWWVPEPAKENLSLSAVVEALLIYGSIEDIKNLFGIVGIKKVAAIFYKSTGDRQRSNYPPEILNFFTLYFKRHA
ncbi:MAG: hypothetical protein MUC94_05545 [bacterium]|nr:hypothetical protein [bacterium]